MPDCFSDEENRQGVKPCIHGRIARDASVHTPRTKNTGQRTNRDRPCTQIRFSRCTRKERKKRRIEAEVPVYVEKTKL